MKTYVAQIWTQSEEPDHQLFDMITEHWTGSTGLTGRPLEAR
jgi:hypothetical protein